MLCQPSTRHFPPGALLAVAWGLDALAGRRHHGRRLALRHRHDPLLGGLYLLAMTGQRWLGAVTPFGGLALLLGWLALAWRAWAA